MSYDVRLEIDTGGEGPAEVTETKEPTYNLAPMFREALGRPMRDREGGPCLNGMLASEALPIIEAALLAMHKDPQRFKALNPPNGWGDYDGAVEFLRWLAEQCAQHPKATVRT